MNKPIIIADYGMGNLGSIANMIKYLGYNSLITSDLKEIESASKIILPGVGHFDRAMANIKSRGMIELFKKRALIDKIPFLGICLGMQLMCNKSEEGNESGLGLINAEVKRFLFDEDSKLKIPHMGWNLIEYKKESLLFSSMIQNPRFYFVHSYHVVCKNEIDVLTTSDYGTNFVSSFSKDNVIGVQFHPEKSHKFGMCLIKNFIEKI